jgi:hypothetical protein
MQTIHGQHASDEDLERYALGGLSADELEEVEEHLILCSSCQERLDETDSFVRTMRAAAAKMRATPEPKRKWFTFRLPWLLTLPTPVWALATATLLVLGVVMLRPGARLPMAGAPPVAVMLEARRGVDVGATAPSGRPLSLEMSLQGLPVHNVYRMELVDAGGSSLWQGAASPQGDRLVAQCEQRLRPGQYWVRIFEPSGKQELLREFGLKAE